LVGNQRLVARDQLRLVRGGLAHRAPDRGDLLVESGIAEVAELADEVGGQVGRRNLLRGDRSEESTSIGSARGQRAQGVAFLYRRPGAVADEQGGGRAAVIVLSQAAQGGPAQVRVVEQSMERRRQFGIARSQQRRQGRLACGRQRLAI